MLIKNWMVIPLDNIFGVGLYSQKKEICIACTIKFILLKSKYSFSAYNQSSEVNSIRNALFWDEVYLGKNGICCSWMKWKLPYFVSMKKINLVHAELSFEIHVHIAQKVEEVTRHCYMPQKITTSVHVLCRMF